MGQALEIIDRPPERQHRYAGAQGQGSCRAVHGDHAVGAADQHVDVRQFQEHDTVLVGRVNYEGFYQYWPKVQRDPSAPAHDVAISRWLDDVQKVDANFEMDVADMAQA